MSVAAAVLPAGFEGVGSKVAPGPLLQGGLPHMMAVMREA